MENVPLPKHYEGVNKCSSRKGERLHTVLSSDL
jgi:hypothetical protein